MPVQNVTLTIPSHTAKIKNIDLSYSKKITRDLEQLFLPVPRKKIGPAAGESLTYLDAILTKLSMLVSAFIFKNQCLLKYV